LAGESVSVLQERLASEQKLVALIDKIHSAKSLDGIFFEVQGEILSFLNTERMTLYVVDPDKKELFSKFLALDAVKEIRLPINENSVAGFVAFHPQTVNVADAYNATELQRISPKLRFDASWDKKTGFRTQQILAMPIMHESKTPVGVIQLLNKKKGGRFTKEDESNVARIAKTLGVAFHTQQMLVQKRGGKFDYLLSQGILTQDELNKAVVTARQKQLDVETVLMEQFKVPKQELGASLSQYYRLPFFEFTEKVIPPPDLMRDLKIEFLKRNIWLPLRRDDHGHIVILIDNPQDIQKVDSIHQVMRGHKITLAIGLKKDIQQWLNVVGGEAANKGNIGEILSDLGAEAATEKELDFAGAEVDENDSAVIRLANQIIVDAFKARASDIHIEPYGAQRDTMIRLRVDGGCAEYQKVPGAFRRALVARVKIMATLDISERRKPQDGKIKFRLPDGRDIELRVATVPTQGGNEDVVMRILSASEPIPIAKLGMSDRNLAEMKTAAEKPYGLILCVGPTGSGKTTTLHSVLGYINKPDKKIWTAEDPVEITQYGLRQVQVQPKIGFTFAQAMRAFLRADPDVIMVGEMRDEETAATGIEASLTGHLVFSTLHTNSAVETVIRLLDMGLDPFNFADALLAVLAQRLVKRICTECKEEYQPDDEEFAELEYAFGGKEEAAKFNLQYDNDFVLYRGKGCSYCNKTGYRGRAAIHELLVATDPMKRLISSKARVTEMLQLAKADGMMTLVQDGILKALDGITDLKQVKAVAIK
jgi:type II secretory ATPase GspE/PulE/Tfp pilus assembly ATPase PilB-like protein/GAF domain-containing protein